MKQAKAPTSLPPSTTAVEPDAPLRLDPDANYTIEQFAAMTGLTPDEVRQRVYKKRIPAVRGFKKGAWLIPADLVRARLEQRKEPLRHLPVVAAQVAATPVDPQSPLQQMVRRAAKES